MGETTGISWCDHTFNPWIGCTKVSPACDGCYAEAMMGENGRYKRVTWGKPGSGAGTRVRTSPSNWRQPLKWDEARAQEVHRAVVTGAALPPPRYVFCASLADVFDNAVPWEWRRDLFDLIRKTPHLTWLLLTKRPGNIVKLFRQTVMPDNHDMPGFGLFARSEWPMNAAIGTSIEDRARLRENAPALHSAALWLKPAFTFWSCEPLLEDLGSLREYPAPDWIIVGGETSQGKHKARDMEADWARSLLREARMVAIPFHLKQMARKALIPADLQIQERPHG